MATKRSSGPAKKTPRAKKKPTVDPVIETRAAEPEPVVTTPIDPPPVAATPAAPDVPIDEIRRRAYNYWVQGNPDPIANWFRAENELKQS